DALVVIEFPGERVDGALIFLLGEALTAPAWGERDDRGGAHLSALMRDLQVLRLENHVGLVAEEGDLEQLEIAWRAGHSCSLRTSALCDVVQALIRIRCGCANHVFIERRDLDQKRTAAQLNSELILLERSKPGRNLRLLLIRRRASSALCRHARR